MTYDFLTNSNLTEEKIGEHVLIPVGTLVKSQFKVIPGTQGPCNLISQNPMTGSDM